jgi:hypothetical protein
MRGVSLVELVVALGVTLVVCGLAAVALVEAGAAFAWQPSAAELAARARGAVRQLTADLEAAGAGPRAHLPPGDPSVPAFPDASRLAAWMPPLLPRIVALDAADADTTAADDRLSIVSIADAAPQAAVRRVGPDLRWVPGPTCPALVDGCAMGAGRAVLALERRRGFRLLEVFGVDADGIRLASGDDVARVDGAALLADADVVTYRFDRARRELLRGRAGGGALPLVDHVAGFAVEYWGDAAPASAPRLESVRLEPATLCDGPWIGEAPWRVDADLFRVRRVRVRLRLQADAAAVRGINPQRFAAAGTATSPAREVPDLDLAIDVAPASLRGGS